MPSSTRGDTGYGGAAMGDRVRPARTADVPGIRALIDANLDSRRLLGKATVTLYEDVQEFWVAERESDGLVVGCGALHVLWEDLAEIRTIAVRPGCQGHGIGRRIAHALLDQARELGVQRVFVLTFAIGFFGSLGFIEIFGKIGRASCRERVSVLV
jgi:amino-acid N-acetyltransferase